MRIDRILLCSAILVVAGITGVAGTVTISGNGDYRAGNGGEFNVVAADAAGAALLAPNLGGYFIDNGTIVGTANGTKMNSGYGGQLGFETFCIEFNEHITLPGTYTASISLGAIYGGVAGGIDHDNNPLTPTTDFISLGTAYLYERFAMGTLAGYTYANGALRATSAVMLQEAIWYLEDEISLNAAQKAANVFLTGVGGAITLFGDGTGVGVGGAKANNTVYNVAALNLGGVAPNQKQDQLILHDNGFTVPDGGLTVMLLGLAVSGLAFVRRQLP
jgi:hypothetical protein